MLEIKKYLAESLEFDEISAFNNGCVKINKAELIAYCLKNSSGYSLDIAIAKPRDNTRIVHITDTVKPSWKVDGSTFPGWLEGDNTCGYGVLHQIEGLSIMQTCEYAGIQEAVVDMSGEGSKYNVFSSLINLVISVDLDCDEYDKDKLAKDLKLIILRAAEYVGSLTKNEEAAYADIVEEKDRVSGLPNIGYVYFIQAQGPLRNVHLYGKDCTKMHPESVTFEEIMDGALVSGNYIIACQKNPTYFHQDNPVIKALRERSGKVLNTGVAIISTEGSLLEEKKENAKAIAELALKFKWGGVIITQEGGGHADVDLMMTTEACQKQGINVVIQTNEIAGARGELPPLVSTSDMADAIITNGNNDEVIMLGSVENVIGGSYILGGKYTANEAFETSLGIIYTATNQLGINKLTTASI